MRDSSPQSNNLAAAHNPIPFDEVVSLVHLLHHRAQHQPDRRAYTFLVDGEQEQLYLTYAGLDQQARTIAAWLQSRGAAGQRVLLLYPPGLDYIAAFLGCLYAGCVAVPAYPPRLKKRAMTRLQAIVADAQAAFSLTTTSILTKLKDRLADFPRLRTMQWLATDTLDDSLAGDWRDPAADRDTLAFLQYTSGSTATPKGVMVSHGNLLHNQQVMQQAFGRTAHDIILGWLPLYHDMGLIGNVLHPLYLGAPCVLMSPLAFLQKPLRWLQAVTTFKATISGGPNFAYDLCVRRIPPEQRAQLDLRCWQVAFNGAEPVRAKTIERFVDAFAPHGFRREVFFPSYGLAEATLMVSGGSKVQPTTRIVQAESLEQNRVVAVKGDDADSYTLVGCGQPGLDQEVVIVDPETRAPCPPDRIGEIWISSPSIAQGYWNNPDDTGQTFAAHLAGTGSGPFLRSGDLGFLQDNELFVTGRLKDLIIIRGRNYYPQDIELTAEQSHPALEPDGAAAFAVAVEGKERLVVVQETNRHHRRPDVETIAAAIREAVADEYGLQVYAVVLIKPATLPKTTSGKVQRRACREQFLAGTLSVLGTHSLPDSYFDWSEDSVNQSRDVFIAPRTPTEEMLVEIWGDVLNLEQVSVYDNFFELGGHSLLATQVLSRLHATFEIDVSLRLLFENSVLAHLAKTIDAQRRAAQGVQTPAIEPVNRNGNLRLSFSQERMWFLDQLETTGAAYNIPVALRLSGSLDVAALEKSFAEIFRRHEILRTNYQKVNGQPVQVIAPERSFALNIIDLRSAPPETREAESQRVVNAEAGRLFDLAQDLLVRVNLLQLDKTEHILLVTMHHIVSDAWSLGVLWQELLPLYNAFSNGRPSSLPDLSLQYADFAHWQRTWLHGNVLETQLAYWQKQLAGAPAVLALPADHPRPPVQTYRGAYKILPLPAALIEAVRALGRQEGATLFMTLLAAFKILLYRYTSQEDILVGTPIANRHWLAVENLLGTFVNTLVMRTDLSGDPTFRQLLSRVREVALAAYAHQDLPFEQLVEQLQPERNLSHSPLVQVTFNVANAPMPVVELPHLTWELFDVDRGAAQFDLSLSMMDTPQLRLMTVEYNTDLFDDTTIERLMGHYQQLLEGIVTDPEQSIASLPLLTAQEQHQLLVAWNDTQTIYPDRQCLHHLFEAQVERTPQAIAAVFGEQTLSYRQLNQRANQLAHYLQTLGVGPDTLVGICVERSLEMMIGLLGILKAGGAYLPLAPNDPQERLSFILTDAQAPVLLTQHHLADQLPAGDAQVVCLDTDWEQIARHSSDAPVSEVTPDNLVYVIYTSGSTGKPKGVMIRHQGVVNYLSWGTQTYPLVDGAGVPLHSSISFDLSVTSLFGPLLVGRAVHLLPNNLGPDVLRMALDDYDTHYSLVKLTPAHLELLNQQLDPNTTANRPAALIIGGENLRADTISFWQKYAPDTRLVNEYGPTETVVGSCVYQVPPGQQLSGSVPIGRPIANTQLYVLDPHLQPVPIGVPGELYIGGAGVARGYLNRPDLTNERFIPNPFSQQPDARLYKTGDLVRYLPDGNLEYLGRLDHQVKLRGYRIELGEIEAVLQQHPTVQEAVAIVREDTPGDKRLVAYVVPSATRNVSVEMLHNFLRDKLPDYMRPAAIVLLETIPLTAGGKINRQLLPAPKLTPARRDVESRMPEDMLERQLVALWQGVLNVEPVAVTDNFFELGGHSLLAVQLFARLETMVGRSLPVSILFQAPTIEQLAQILRREGWSPRFSSLVAIQPQGDRPPFFCVHGLGGGILGYADLAHDLGVDQPFYGLQERAMSGPYESLTRIEEMAAHYLQEIRTLQPEGPYFIGGYCFGGTVAFEMARQLHAQGQKVALLAIIDNAPPNSGYYESIWKPRVLLKFLQNIPYWLHDFLQLEPQEMGARIMRKLRMAVQAINRKFSPPATEPSRIDIESIIDDDFSQLPVENQQYLRSHYLALVNYTPQIYAGRITLFRTRRYSLLGPYDPQMGWRKLATRGVEVKEIQGFHANILQAPYVEMLAEQLRTALAEAQKL